MKNRRHWPIGMGMILLLAAVLFFPFSSAEAAKKAEISEEWTLYKMGGSEPDTNYLEMTYLPQKARITKVVSSNPKVAQGFVQTWSDGEQSVGILKKKTGTVNLKIRVKQGKNTYLLRTKVTIRKHKNLFTSFKIGKTDIRKMYKNAEYADVTMPSGKKKVQIKLAKGWKLDKITYQQGKKVRTLKNGKALNFDRLSDGAMMDISVYQEKTGRVRSFQVYFYLPEEEPEVEETQAQSESQTESETQAEGETQTESETLNDTQEGTEA